MKPCDPSLPCKSAKQEEFCQLLAAGVGVKESYLRAGYANGRHAAQNADKLKHQLRPRIAYLEKELAAEKEQVRRDAVKKTAITVQWFYECLKTHIEMLEKERPVFRGGRPTGESRYDGRALNKALELAGKTLGMFSADDHLQRQRHEQMTEAERIAENRQLFAEARQKRNQLRSISLRRRVANDNWGTGRTVDDDHGPGPARNSRVPTGQPGGADTGAGGAHSHRRRYLDMQNPK
jgi:hypothetical protein